VTMFCCFTTLALCWQAGWTSWSGVLLHEVHHVVFGHVVADPDDFPDRWARIVAEEVTVNEFVTEPLPVTPVAARPVLRPAADGVDAAAIRAG
jgi:hypothetical protein